MRHGGRGQNPSGRGQNPSGMKELTEHRELTQHRPSNGAGPAAAEFDEAAVRAATMIQARWKGRRARRRLLEAQVAVAPPPSP